MKASKCGPGIYIITYCILIAYVTVEGRNQTLFTLSTFEKKKKKFKKAENLSVMTKVNFD